VPDLERLANRAFEIVLEERVVIESWISRRQRVGRTEIPGPELGEIDAPFDMGAYVHGRAPLQRE
jgi:hypothetical protein